MSIVRGGVFLFLLLSFSKTLAQESVTQETNAPGIKWYQLNSPNFRILYPKGFDVSAQRVANTLETLRTPEAKSMGVLPKKISIILQNQSSLSNGFVTLAPRRSEFYTMPPQDYNFAGTNDWLNILASHEYRHVVQFQRSITGFNKVISLVFGQQATAGMAFAAAPSWFWEGDAVATETAFTTSGRGRIPNFDLLFRTNLLSGRTFNYHKQYLQSYKHNIPNHYVLGYNMVSYLRKKTGDPLIWEKIVGRSWSAPFIPFAFSNAIKNKTGLYVKDLFNEMAQERKKDYEEALSDLKLSPFESITHRKSRAYTDYSFPQVLENGKLLITKSGIGDIETLEVLSSDGAEEGHYIQGPVNASGQLSATNLRVVWNEYRYDPRWLVHNYSVIKGYDFGARKARKISTKSRYSSAAISPDGYQVATIETSPDYAIQLVILDYFSGKVIRTFSNATNDLLAMPRWSPDGKSILALRTTSAGKTITKFNVAEGSSTDLIPFSQENIGYPVAYDRYIFYNSPVTGIDNIFALDVATQERFQVTSSRLGAYNAAVSKDGKTLYYNDQTADGMDVVRASLNPANWKKFEIPAPSSNSIFQHLVDQELSSDLFKNIPQTQYPSSRYYRSQGMVNPHSWGPYFINSLTQAQIGISSQDILSTTTINGGYVFDVNERTGSWQANVSYQGLYPILDFSYSQATRSVNEGDYTFLRIDTLQKAPIRLDTTAFNRNITFHWNEKTVETGLRIPLITTSSKFLSKVSFGNFFGYTHVTDFTNSYTNSRIIPAVERSGPTTAPTPSTKDGSYFFRSYADNGNLLYNHFSLSLYRVLKKSKRDINSKWGQTINLDYYNTPYGGDFSGGQFSFYGVAYFPGPFKHHSIWGYWAYQRSAIEPGSLSNSKVHDNYLFRNQIPLPRGQSISRAQNFYSMAINYTLPVWYPDISLGPVLNIQRVRANGFYDYGFGSSPGFATATSSGNRAYSSVGVEVKFDINVMRFLPQFNVGFRYSYGIQPSVTRFDVLIGSINF